MSYVIQNILPSEGEPHPLNYNSVAACVFKHVFISFYRAMEVLDFLLTFQRNLRLKVS